MCVLRVFVWLYRQIPCGEMLRRFVLFWPSWSWCCRLSEETFALSSGVSLLPDASRWAAAPAGIVSSRTRSRCSPASAWCQTGSLPATCASSDTGLSHAPSVQTLCPVERERERTAWFTNTQILQAYNSCILQVKFYFLAMESTT